MEYIPSYIFNTISIKRVLSYHLPNKRLVIFSINSILPSIDCWSVSMRCVDFANPIYNW